MEVNVTESTIDKDQITEFEIYFYVIFGLIGIIFNGLVLFIGLRHVDTHDKPRQIIVMNMTLSDLLACLIYISTRPVLSRAPRVMCYPYYILIFISQFSSCLHLLWLNLDKFIYIKYPLNYYLIVTRRRVLSLCWVTWAVLTALGAVSYSTMDILHPCDGININHYIYLCIVVMYVVIISASFAISAVIYCIATNSRRMEPSARSQLFKRLFFVFSSTTWTFVTILPYRMLYLSSLMMRDWIGRKFSYFFIVLTNLFLYFIVIGIVMNPLVTILTQRLYREKVFYYFKWIVKLCPFIKSSPPSIHENTTVSYSGARRLLSVASALPPTSKVTSPANRKRFNSCIEVPVRDENGRKKYEALRVHHGHFNEVQF